MINASELAQRHIARALRCEVRSLVSAAQRCPGDAPEILHRIANLLGATTVHTAGGSAEELFNIPVRPSGGHQPEDLPFHGDGSIYDIEDAVHKPTTQQIVYEHEQSYMGPTQFLKPEVDYDFLR